MIPAYNAAQKANWPQVPEGSGSGNPLKKLDRYIRAHETSFDRMARVRNAIETQSAESHHWDRTLACPEQFESRFLRGLIYASKYLEEVAEAVADVSGAIERISRNLMSAGNKCDMAQVIGSGLGRVISGFLSTPGFAVHKVLGTGIYGLSVFLGGLALVCARLSNAKRIPEERVHLVQRGKLTDKSIYQELSGAMAGAKEQLIEGTLTQLKKAGFENNHPFQKWCRHLSSKHNITNDIGNRSRRANCNYMWNNLHQYGPVTKALVCAAYGIFQGVNKLMGSYDKYLGAEFGRRVLSKKMGTVLGLKVGLCLSTGIAAAISVPTSPLIVGLATIGACACGFALLALLTAKLNVKYRYDWLGNCSKREPARHINNDEFRFSAV